MNRVSGTAEGAPSGCFPGQEGGHRGALGAGHIRRDPEPVADRLHRDPRVVVDHERPAQHAHACRARVRDVEAAVRQRPVIARSHDQVPAALPPVRARQAEVGDPPEPHIVDRAQDPRRRAERGHVEHHRPGAQVGEAEEVDRVAVPGQEQRRRVHQLREQQDLVVLHPDREEPLADGRQRRAGERVDERLHPVHEVQVVIQQLRRRLGRRPVAELQRPQAALHPVRRRDRPQRLRRHAILSATAHRILRFRRLCYRDWWRCRRHEK